MQSPGDSDSDLDRKPAAKEISSKSSGTTIDMTRCYDNQSTMNRIHHETFSQATTTDSTVACVPSVLKQSLAESNQSETDKELQNTEPSHPKQQRLTTRQTVRFEDNSERMEEIHNNNSYHEGNTRVEREQISTIDDSLVSHLIFDGVPENKKDLYRFMLFQSFASDRNDGTGVFADLIRKISPIDFRVHRSKILDYLARDQRNMNLHDDSLVIDPNLPKKVGDLAKTLRDKSCIMEEPFSQQHQNGESQQDYNQRIGCTSLRLSELEESTRSTRQWYLNNAKIGDTSVNSAGIPARKPATFFSLKFNEGSLSTVSKWTCQNRSSGVQSNGSVNGSKKDDTKSVVDRIGQSNKPTTITDGEQKNGSTPIRVVKQPTVDARFRKCSICQLWGHYEIECSRLPCEEVLRFGNEIKLLTEKCVPYDDTTNTTVNDSVVTKSFETYHTIAKHNIRTVSQPRDFRGLHLGIGCSEYLVTVEIFKGFIIEQRRTPEKIISIEQPVEKPPTVDFPLYDDSFTVDGFQIRSSSSLKGFDGGRVKRYSRQKQSRKRQREETNRMNDFIFRQSNSSHRESFREGDIVAWYPNLTNDSNELNDDIFTGIVMKDSQSEPDIYSDKERRKGEESKKKICVQLVGCIPSSSGFEFETDKAIKTKAQKLGNDVDTDLASNTNQGLSTPANPIIPTSVLGTKKQKLLRRCRPLPPIGVSIWVPELNLYLVEENTEIAHQSELKGFRRKYAPRKRLAAVEITEIENILENKTEASSHEASVTTDVAEPKSNKKSRRKVPYAKRCKERLSSGGMSIGPKTPARKRDDGSFSLPQGRKPVGFDWDSVHGHWKLPVGSKKEKKQQKEDEVKPQGKVKTQNTKKRKK